MYNFTSYYTRGLHDPQDELPVYYCARCQGEIYYGEICYPLDGWQVLCEECHDETGDDSNIFIYAGDDNDTVIHVKYVEENDFGEE